MEYTTAFEQVVAWGDMDAFGHVNNTVYLRYFESARVRYLEEIPELAVFKETEMPVLANIACSFKKPVVYPDTLTVKLGVESIGKAKFKMTCEMHSPKVGLAAVCECTIVIINSKTGRSVRVPAIWRECIERIEGRSFEV